MLAGREVGRRQPLDLTRALSPKALRGGRPAQDWGPGAAAARQYRTTLAADKLPHAQSSKSSRSNLGPAAGSAAISSDPLALPLKSAALLPHALKVGRPSTHGHLAPLGRWPQMPGPGIGARPGPRGQPADLPAPLAPNLPS